MSYHPGMQKTADMTSTGARNVPSAPSLMDRARKQARESDTAVYYITPFGAGVSFPTDYWGGHIWAFGSTIEAQEWLTAQGWGDMMESLKDEASK